MHGVIAVANPKPIVVQVYRPPRLVALWKRCEPLLGLVILAMAAPFIVAMVLLVRVVSPGPAIFRQRRVGLGGKVFTIYKIRTMRLDAERETGAVWASSSDSRLIRFGYLMRLLHLDELPQLFNVILGDMSLVGPRPERPELIESVASQIPEYIERLRLKPGVTGLAQVTHGPDLTIDMVRRKVQLDLAYLDAMSIRLDIQIILCTLLQFLRFPHAATRSLTFLTKLTAVPDESPDEALKCGEADMTSREAEEAGKASRL